MRVSTLDHLPSAVPGFRHVFGHEQFRDRDVTSGNPQSPVAAAIARASARSAGNSTPSRRRSNSPARVHDEQMTEADGRRCAHRLDAADRRAHVTASFSGRRAGDLLLAQSQQLLCIWILVSSFQQLGFQPPGSIAHATAGTSAPLCHRVAAYSPPAAVSAAGRGLVYSKDVIKNSRSKASRGSASPSSDIGCSPWPLEEIGQSPSSRTRVLA